MVFNELIDANDKMVDDKHDLVNQEGSHGDTGKALNG